MSLIKALLLGAILTFVVSATIHAGGSTGGFLYIRELQVSGQFVSWSWPLFIASAGLAFGILKLME
jgi:hypothetical protein